ncbi:hypothetical protein WA026_013938 [Henosepilachna vigintioctopunctata]|uniref:Uncharacterized protein n=1 Tax=Henosepilachna vigintioctopunctata TaxID=420089 RepID=A0AAW1U7D3_9CUCU
MWYHSIAPVVNTLTSKYVIVHVNEIIDRLIINQIINYLWPTGLTSSHTKAAVSMSENVGDSTSNGHKISDLENVLSCSMKWDKTAIVNAKKVFLSIKGNK